MSRAPHRPRRFCVASDLHRALSEIAEAGGADASGPAPSPLTGAGDPAATGLPRLRRVPWPGSSAATEGAGVGVCFVQRVPSPPPADGVSRPGVGGAWAGLRGGPHSQLPGPAPSLSPFSPERLWLTRTLLRSG